MAMVCSEITPLEVDPTKIELKRDVMGFLPKNYVWDEQGVFYLFTGNLKRSESDGIASFQDRRIFLYPWFSMSFMTPDAFMCPVSVAGI